jgi:hypothetical protein
MALSADKVYGSPLTLFFGCRPEKPLIFGHRLETKDSILTPGKY